MSARSVLSFRADFLVGLFAHAAEVALVVMVWRAVYGDRTEIDGISAAHAVAYAVLAVTMSSLLNPWNFSSLQERVRRGTVAGDLLRPMPFVLQVIAQQLGVTLASTPRAVVGIVVGVLAGAFVLPVGGATTVLLFVVSVVLGVGIALLCNLIVGLTAFWTVETSGAMIVYRVFVSFASGALIPLWFLPDWLVPVVSALPFQAQVFVPLSLYFADESSGPDPVGLVVQVVWVVVLAALAQLVWTRALRRVTIHGG